jgi:hypothetical protein
MLSASLLIKKDSLLGRGKGIWKIAHLFIDKFFDKWRSSTFRGYGKYSFFQYFLFVVSCRLSLFCMLKKSLFQSIDKWGWKLHKLGGTEDLNLSKFTILLSSVLLHLHSQWKLFGFFCISQLELNLVILYLHIMKERI